MSQDPTIHMQRPQHGGYRRQTRAQSMLRLIRGCQAFVPPERFEQSACVVYTARAVTNICDVARKRAAATTIFAVVNDSASLSPLLESRVLAAVRGGSRPR